MVSLLSNFFIQFNFFATFSSRFSLASIPSAYCFPCFLPSFADMLCTSAGVPGIQFSSKCFNGETIKYYIGPPDLNSEPNTEVDERETQLGLCRGTAICFDYC